MKIVSQIACIFLGILVFSSGQKDIATIEIGTSAPKADMKMMGTDGSSHSLNSLKKENGLLVIFSCNTCPFVVGSESFQGWEVQYSDIASMTASMNIGSVLVNSNEAKRDGDDSMEAMKKRATDMGYKMPYVMDSDSKLADEFGAKTTPHIFLFNEDMKLVYSGTIDNLWDSKRTETFSYLKNAVRDLTSKTAITTAVTPPRGCGIKRK